MRWAKSAKSKIKTLLGSKFRNRHTSQPNKINTNDSGYNKKREILKKNATL